MRTLHPTARHAVQSVPGTLVPGVASGLGLVVVGRWAGAATLGLVAIAWVTSNLGSALVALGPAHAAIRAVATDAPGGVSGYRGVAARRAVVAVPLLGLAGVALWAAGASVGAPLALAAPWTGAQAMILFESEVLRAEGRFGRASTILSLRAVLGWSASALGAALLPGLAGVVLPQVVITAACWVALAGRAPVTAPDRATATAARELGGPVTSLGLAGYVLGYADRYVIAALAGPAAVGVYTLGYTLGQGVVEVIGTPVTNALLPRLVTEWCGPGGPAVARATARRAALALAATGLVAVVAVVVADRLGLLRPVSTHPRLAAVAALVAVATAVQMVNRLSYALLLADARPAGATRAFWQAVAVSAVAVPVLTAAWGIVGAAVATLLAYVLLGALLVARVGGR